MLLKELIGQAMAILIPSFPEREAREMVYAFLEDTIGTRRHTHIVEPEYAVSDDVSHTVLDAFRRMASGEPLQYVTGHADFYGRRFRVTPDVLIPRPETELLCREVLEFPSVPDGRINDHIRVLDLCTGSGCIAWTLALEMPGAEVTAMDISDAALTVASSQDFSDEVVQTGAVAPKFVKADVLAGPPCDLARLSDCRYDIIVSNPPYVMDKEKALMRPNVLDHEPHLALFVPDEDPLLFYKAVATWAAALLKPGGFGIVEINEAFGVETAEVFRAAGFHSVEIIRDLSDRHRFVAFRSASAL